jgi:uncharacterized protein (DUF1697 family)
MPTYVILLRAVNVGSTGKLPMADFRKLLAEVKCANIETYIQSGNAVVDAKCSAAALAKTVAAALAKYMGSPVPVIVRTHAELDRLIAANPFAKEAAADGARVHVAFLEGPAGSGAPAALEAIVKQYPKRRDRYHLAGDAIYFHFPDGAAETKFSGKTLDRAIGVAGTGRNWNTVLKLHAMSAR